MKKLNLGKLWNENKKVIVGAGIVLVLAVAGITTVVVANQETITQESTSFVVNVNDEVEQDATKYLKGIKDPTQAVFKLDGVNTKEIGIYDASIEYKGETYNIKIDVRDMEAPKVEMSQTEFEYSTDTSIDDINNDINDCITITDNCDQEFDPIAVVTEVPTEPTEQTYNVSVKDKSGNTSEKVQVKVTYTEPEEEPEEPEANEPETNGSYNNGGSSSSTGGSTSGGSSSTGGSSSSTGGSTSGGSTATPTPQPEPEPLPDSNKPVQIAYPKTQPGDLIGGEFATDTEAEAWIFSYTENPESEWYHHNSTEVKLANGNWYAWIDK